MKKIIIIGCGGHANSCIEIIENSKEFKIYGLVCDKKKGKFDKYKILGSDKSLGIIKKNCSNAFIGIGQIKSYRIREKLFKILKKKGFKLPKILAKNSYISKSSKIGEGTIVMHNAFINRNVSIGDNTIINTGAIIEHDVCIGSNCHISTGAIINGGVKIDNGTFVGSGSVINQGINIGKNCIISSSSKIKIDLNSGSVVK